MRSRGHPSPTSSKFSPNGRSVRDVQVHDVGLPSAGHQAERAGRQVAVRIDQHYRWLLVRVQRDQLLPQGPQERRLALAGLGHQQGMAAQQGGRKVDDHLPAQAILGDPEPGTVSDCRRQRQETAGSGALDECHVVAGLDGVPEGGQLARAEHSQLAGPTQQPRRTHGVERGRYP